MLWQRRHQTHKRRRSHGNQIIREETKSKGSWKWKLYLVLLGLLLVITLWFLFFSDSFRLETISIGKVLYAERGDIEQMVHEQTSQPHLWLLPGDNLILFDSQKLSRQLHQAYALQAVVIKKKLNHQLIIELTEKPYELVWIENNVHYRINRQGDIIIKDLPDLNENLPSITNRGEARLKNRSIAIEPASLSFAYELDEKLQQDTSNLSNWQIFIDNDYQTVKVAVGEGPILIFSTDEELDKQLTKLDTLRRELLPSGAVFNNQEYIDLRYGQNVFYK